MQPIIDIIAENPAPAVKQAIDAAFTAYNAEVRAFAPEPPDFAVALRDPETGEITGGLYAADGYGWAFIMLLVVPDRYRRQGLGTQLLAEAEAMARARGYIGMWLDTFEFQARRFAKSRVLPCSANWKAVTARRRAIFSRRDFEIRPAQ